MRRNLHQVNTTFILYLIMFIKLYLNYVHNKYVINSNTLLANKLSYHKIKRRFLI